ncbi:MAG TPA: 16S rRNA (cytosine(1402)-N(4))-methyltransferase RsmH [Burkholderiaceae bacterium]|nr:16S rRNA (cytosine(1402)-N(4))-methyltransferase RsmH [Burkholderiaceae bacterium]
MNAAGNSESGAHAPVLAETAVGLLITDPKGIYVDATFGRGGHSRLILAHLATDGRLIALDRDPQAREAARTWADPRFEFVQCEFSHLAAVLAQRLIAHIDGLLIDLGVSSPQLDDAQRGFSLRADGPLDMRMNPEHGRSAAQWLATVSVEELKRVLRDYGDERFAAPIAKAIVARREDGHPILRTAELATVVASAIPVRSRKDPTQHPATRTFQAIRIFINQELEEVALILNASLLALAPGGRLAVITFHSLEDRIVKRFMDAQAHPDRATGRLPLRASQLPRPRLRVLTRMTPSASEVQQNPRARSAHLRVAERTDVPLDRRT